MAVCGHCGQMSLIGRNAGLVHVGPKAYACPSCIEAMYERCHDCGKMVHSGDMATVSSSWNMDGTRVMVSRGKDVDDYTQGNMDVRVCDTCRGKRHCCPKCGLSFSAMAAGTIKYSGEWHCPSCSKMFVKCFKCGQAFRANATGKVHMADRTISSVCVKCISSFFNEVKGYRTCSIDACHWMGHDMLMGRLEEFDVDEGTTCAVWLCPGHKDRYSILKCGHISENGEWKVLTEETIAFVLGNGEIDVDGVPMDGKGKVSRWLESRRVVVDDKICGRCDSHLRALVHCRSFIESHNSSPDYLVFHHVDRPGEGPYLGFELEVDRNAMGDADKCAYDVVKNVGSRHVSCKHDGSLLNGVEFVTHPATMDYMYSERARYERMMAVSRSRGWLSHDIGTCGLHVHVGRDWLGSEAVCRLGVLTELFWPELFMFSRRDNATSVRWAKRQFGKKDQIGMYRDAKTALAEIKSINEKICGRGHCLERYVTFNMCNRMTVEFRIFRGTLNVTTFWATLQLVDNMCRKAKDMKDEDIGSVSWMDIISERRWDELDDYNSRMVGAGWNGDRAMKMNHDCDESGKIVPFLLDMRGCVKRGNISGVHTLYFSGGRNSWARKWAGDHYAEINKSKAAVSIGSLLDADDAASDRIVTLVPGLNCLEVTILPEGAGMNKGGQPIEKYLIDRDVFLEATGIDITHQMEEKGVSPGPSMRAYYEYST